MLLAEELLLLATAEAPLKVTDDHPSSKCTDAIPYQVRKALSYVLPAAIISEMALHGQIRLNEDEKIITTTRTPEPVSAVEQIWKDLQKSQGKYTPQTWYRVFALSSGKRRMLLSKQLVERGRMREEQKRFLGVFPYSIFVLTDESSPRKLKSKVLDSLRTGSIKNDPRLIVNARLCAASGLLALWVSKEELAQFLSLLDELTNMNVWTNELRKEQGLQGSDSSDSAMLAIMVSSSASGGSDGAWTTDSGSYGPDSPGGADGGASDSSSSDGGGGGDGGGGD